MAETLKKLKTFYNFCETYFVTNFIFYCERHRPYWLFNCERNIKKVISNMILSNIEYRKIEYDFPNIRANHTARLQIIYLLSYIYFLCQNSWESTTIFYYIHSFEIHNHLLIKLLWKSSLLSKFVYFLENVGTF